MISTSFVPLVLWFCSLVQATKTAKSFSLSYSSSSDPSTTTWTGAPWQSTDSNSRSILEESTYEGYPPIVFSPTGRLHAVEGVVKASKLPHPTSNLVLALHCRDGLVVISTLPTSPHLNTTNTNKNVTSLFLVNETTMSPIVDLHPCLVAATAGNVVAGNVMRNKVQSFAEAAMEVQGDSVQASELARRIADHLQVSTQNLGGRGGPMLASAAVILGNRQIWRIDPTGQFWKCHAVAMGRDADRAEAELHQTIVAEMSSESDNDNGNGNGNGNDEDVESFLERLSSDSAISLACKCMESVLWPKKQAVVAGSTSSSIFWKAVVLDYGDTNDESKPKRRIQRGAFLPPQQNED